MNNNNIINNSLLEAFKEEQIVDKFIYFTNRNRAKRCSEMTIRNAYRNSTLAQLIKKMDVIVYNELLKDLKQ